MYSFSTNNINIHYDFIFVFVSLFLFFWLVRSFVHLYSRSTCSLFPCSATLKHQFICHRHLLFRCLFLCKFSIDSRLFSGFIRYISMYQILSLFQFFIFGFGVVVLVLLLFFTSFDFISHTCSIFMSFSQ